MDALAVALTLLDRLPALIDAGVKVGAIIQDHKAMQATWAAEKRDPTAAEWQSLNASLDALEKQLQG